MQKINEEEQTKLKKSVIEEISKRTEMIVSDCRTYLWAKTDANSIFRNAVEINKQKLGGGNLLSILGAISTLVFLSKIFYLFRKPDYYDELHKKYDDFKLEFEKSNFKDFLSKWKEIIELKTYKYQFNEEKCFKKLLKSAPLTWKENDDKKLTNLYQSYRNELVHMIKSKDTVSAISIENNHKSFDDIADKIIKSDIAPFLFTKIDVEDTKINEGNYKKVLKPYSWHIECYSEILILRDIPQVLSWIIRLLDDNSDFKIFRVLNVFLKNSGTPYNDLHYSEILLKAENNHEK